MFRSFEAFQSHHALALLFSVFALATHFDRHREPYSLESREYYELARTTLGFASPVKQTTLAAIQTLASGVIRSRHGDLLTARKDTYGPISGLYGFRVNFSVDLYRTRRSICLQCECICVVSFSQLEANSVPVFRSAFVSTFHMLMFDGLLNTAIHFPDLNGERWALPSSDIDRRSRVFWQLFTLDTWTVRWNKLPLIHVSDQDSLRASTLVDLRASRLAF